MRRPTCTLARCARRALAILAVLAAVAGAARAQSRVRLEATVTAVAGNSVYLDKGRDDGVRPDDEVLLYAVGAPDLPAVVVAISSGSCRVEHHELLANVPIGGRAVVLLPRDRELEPRTEDPGYQPGAIPDELPWSHPPVAWEEESPLLAPALGLRREERETVWRSRLTSDYRGIRNDEYGTTYTTARVGFDTRAENPFHRGGTLHVNVDGTLQDATLSGAPDVTDTYLRVNRLSYERGGTREDPNLYEVGRFLHNEFPELGVVDGAEWVHRLPSGSRFGVSAGALPEPFPDFESGDDLGVAAFYRYVSGEEEDLALGVALQNTWHEGSQDRTLILATADWAPGPRTSLYAAAWIDYYDSTAVLKSPGLELTELRAHARFRPDDASGVGLHASRVRWPEIERHEFAPVSPELIEDGVVDRVGLDGYRRLDEHLRLNARLDFWRDQDDDGLAYQAGASLRELLYERGEVGLTLFRTDGRYTGGPGLRAYANRRFDRGLGTLTYDFVEWEGEGGNAGTFQQHAVIATFDLILGTRGVLSFLGDRRFGDSVESYGLGLRYTLNF